ncbi:MAG TPA: tetratricopeptide repeat protein, partial [Cyclobacteriaceae bacterium]|nr:tetratricopeptide repeat protein [Cyclobacteriaceae bacterium]
KSEYIEVLHRNYGAAAALDSLNQIASSKQKKMPFLLGYAAHMEAELGKFESAIKKANQLSKLFNHSSAKPLVVFGDIYFQKGDKKKAADYINKALEIDPGNIDAQRLRSRLNN